MPTQRWKRALQFNLAALLFLMLCVCAFFGSYRYGEQVGEKDKYNESFFVRLYSVADLMIDVEDGKRDAAANEIVARLRSIAPPRDNEPSDVEQGVVEWSTGTCSLVVSQRGAVHDRIAAALNEMRREASVKLAENAIETLGTLARDKARAPVVLISHKGDFMLQMAAIDQNYSALVKCLTKSLGSPTFAGQCTQQGFPPWSLAQSIATWPMKGGAAYVAVQDDVKAGRIVAAGWRDTK